MVDGPGRRRRRRSALHGLLPAGALLAALPWGWAAQAQTPGGIGSSPAPSASFPAPAPGGGQFGFFGPPTRPFEAFGDPRSPGGTDTSRFWLPQLYPDRQLMGGGGQGVAPPTWSIRPSITVLGAATDNINNSATNRQSDFYTVITPSLTIGAQTPRIVGALSYQPSLRLHARTPQNNRFDQFLSGSATAILVPEFLFLDVSGSTDPVSVFGEFGRFSGLGDSAFGRENRIQGSRYRISPYILYRFGDFATGRVGYAFEQSFARGARAFLPGETQPFFTAQTFTSHEIFASVTSGPDFSRFGWNAAATSTQFEGDGAFDGAYRRLYTLGARYDLTREWALLGEAGWQEERYSGVRPFEVNAPVWNIGVRYTPSPNSFLSVRYGQRDGFRSWQVDGGLLLGTRTFLVVNYGERIGSDLLRPNPFGVTPRVDALGNVVDPVTGLPIAIVFDRPLQTQQSSVFRIRSASIAASQAWLRDTYTVALSRTEREPVAIAPGTIAFSEDTSAVTLAWTRALDPTLSLSTALRYAVSESDARGGQRGFSLQAGLSRVFTDSLIGTLQVQHSNSDFDRGGRAVQNIVFVTLRQFF